MKNNYSIIDKDINKYRSGKNKNVDIYLYAFLHICANFKTGISHITQQKILELTKIKFKTIQNATSRLRLSDLVIVDTQQIKEIRHNTYYLNPKPANYFFLNNTFFYVDTNVKLKGLQLLIKSLCINNSNTILYNRTKIAELIGQTRDTVSKMINELIQKNMLLELTHGFQLPANYFPLYAKDKMSKQNYENFKSWDQFVLDSILELCTQQGTVLFTPDLRPLKLIFARYYFQEKDIASLDPEQLKSCYLPEVLKARCPTLPPKIESLNYFLKVLNIEYVKSEKCSDTIIL